MSRPHVEIVHESDFAPGALPYAGWPGGERARILSTDPETGALSAVVELPAGYRRAVGCHAARSELVVLAGELRIGGAIGGHGTFSSMPEGVVDGEWSTPGGATVFLMTRGRADFERSSSAGVAGAPAGADPGSSGRILLEAQRLPWVGQATAGPPPGIFSKRLRFDEATGERVFLCAMVPRYDYPLIEYHDCAEESYVLRGDVRMGTSGLMVAGSYFWRPAYITHGPFFTTEGFVAVMYVDGTLVNHYVDDPRRTPDENRAEAAAKRAETARG